MLPTARETLCDATLERNLSPARIHLHGTSLIEEIVAITAPVPLLRRLHQSTFYGIAMHVPQLLDPLLRAPYVEVIEARLPEHPPVFLAEQFALARIASFSLGQQRVRGALFEHLHDRRRGAHFRFRDQEVNMLGHHDVADHDKAVSLAGLFEHGKEAIARLW